MLSGAHLLLDIGVTWLITMGGIDHDNSTFYGTRRVVIFSCLCTNPNKCLENICIFYLPLVNSVAKTNHR